jgi:polysaccharide export outer membrane protein
MQHGSRTFLCIDVVWAVALRPWVGWCGFVGAGYMKFIAGCILSCAVMLSSSEAAVAQPPTNQQLLDSALTSTPPSAVPDDRRGYRLGSGDKISVQVFGQEKMSVKGAQLDAGGFIILPFAGAIKAGGQTAEQVSDEITVQLRKYLVDPRVSVLIDEAASQRVTVTGAVIESGVYTLKGPTTLLEVVSLAKGPDNKIADLREVTVFRMVDGRRNTAMFDFDAIRRGKSEDPVIFGGDTVVIPISNKKNAWRELIGALPAFGVFTLFH